jgi:hypothetical protein
MSPILGIYASSMKGESNSYESIATANGTGSSGTITFSSIPSTYTHLQLRVISRGTATANDAYFANFNSDTGGNYYLIHVLYGNGSSAGVFASGTSATRIQLSDIVGSSSTANTYAASITDILDYTNTNKYKTVRTLYGFDTNGAGTVALSSGLWMSTSAITSLVLTTSSGNFATNTTFALYGIKG